jgi:hypothetical protein
MREIHAKGVKVSRLQPLCEILTFKFIGFFDDFLIGIGVAKEVAEPG